MLRNLYVKSFVIIDEVNIDFYHGMNVITGETGAGKSIIIDAIGQLCGDRSSNALIKKNESEAKIEGIFDNPNLKALDALCDENHIELDDTFHIKKTILCNGKSNIKINDTTVTNRTLKQIVPLLVDIHSQFDTGRSFTQSNHIHLLDQFINKSVLLNEYKEHYSSYIQLQNDLEEALEEELSDEQLDFIKSQIKEIDEYYYSDEEVDAFEEELKVLSNYEKLHESISAFDQLMNNDNAALSLIKEALNYLSKASEVEEFNSLYETLNDYYYNMQDVSDNVISTFKSLAFDEYRFNELQDITFNISRLKRKYGLTMARVLETKHQLEIKAEIIENRDEFIKKLNNQIHEEKHICESIASKITAQRKEGALNFKQEIESQLPALYLENAQVDITVEETTLNSNGADEVVMMVSMNKGQAFTPLNESASGGEIARLMLIVKTIMAKNAKVDTIIFDEIDTGVSGKVASSIGKHMNKLANSIQVLCITHLPQVAVSADYHYLIEKEDIDNNTISTIKLLDQDNRVLEIAKMLSDENVSEEAINNAKMLLLNN